MIQRIKKGNDLVDVICGNIDFIQEIKYYTTDKDSAITCNWEKVEDDIIEVYLNSQDVDNLESGQLRCIIVQKQDNENFKDSTYDKIIDNGLNCWLED